MSGFGGLFWVRRVCWRVNISLPERKTARHRCEILSSYSFDDIREELRTTQYFALFAYPLKLFYLSVKRDPTSCMALCVARSSTPPANTEEWRSPFLRARWCLRIGSVLSGVGRLRVLIGSFRRFPVSLWLVSVASCSRKRHVF